jgi:hypothetical protein
MRERYLAALRESGNLWFLGGATTLALLWHAPLWLLAAFGFELLYLALLPRLRWYDARLQRRRALRRQHQRQHQRQALRLKILPRLRLDLRARYNRLEALRAGLDAQIAQQYPRWVDELPWLRDLRGQLDALLENFLQLAARETQFRAELEAAQQHLRENGYGFGAGRSTIAAPPSGARQLDARGRGLAGVLPPPSPFSTPVYPESLATSLARRGPEADSPFAPTPLPPAAPPLQHNRDDHWVRETVRAIGAGHARAMADLERQREHETNADTRAVLDARLEVLRKRRAQTEQTGQILNNLHHQLRLVEDAFELISNELNSRPPEQILADVEDVIGQTESMTRVLEELLPGEAL